MSCMDQRFHQFSTASLFQDAKADGARSWLLSPSSTTACNAWNFIFKTLGILTCCLLGVCVSYVHLISIRTCRILVGTSERNRPLADLSLWKNNISSRKVARFWEVLPCSLVDSDQRFTVITASVIRAIMEAVITSERSVSSYRTTQPSIHKTAIFTGVAVKTWNLTISRLHIYC
jgi:hypothetical protein